MFMFIHLFVYDYIIIYKLSMFVNFRLNGPNRVFCGTLDTKMKDPYNPGSQPSQSTQHTSRQKTESSELEVKFPKKF